MKFLFFFVTVVYCHSSFAGDCPGVVRDLAEPELDTSAKFTGSVDLFVYDAGPSHPMKMFTDVFVVLNLTDKDTFKIYQGPNCSVVLEEYNEDNRLFGLLKVVSSWRSHHLPPFDRTIVGIDTLEGYSIAIRKWQVNYIRAGVFIGAVLLFLFASRLVRNTMFYYTSGCSFGLFASLLLVVFIVYRVAPKKAIGLPILLGGWSISLYMLHFAFNNVTSILLNYQKYVAAYFLTVLLISFFVCYKRGPPTDTRSHDIAQWTLQLLALLLIYLSSQVAEVSLCVIGILVLHQLTKSWLWTTFNFLGRSLRWIWRCVFPSRPRFLTEEEYERQTRETTELELRKLREFCRSPKADTWNIVRTVKNPQRLSRFIDGTENHVSENEEVDHESEGDILDSFLEDRDIVQEDFDQDDSAEYVDEIILRRSSVGTSELANVSRIKLARGVSKQLLVDRLTASAGREQFPARSSFSSSTRGSRGRHSLAATSFKNNAFSTPGQHSLANASSSLSGKRGKPAASAKRSSKRDDRSNLYLSSDSDFSDAE